MTFFGNLDFFIAFLVLLIPAIFLGFLGKKIAPYGFMVSFVFIAFIFSKSKREVAFFLFFIICETILAFIFFKLRLNKKNKYLFWLAVTLSISPLVIYKISALFESNLFGFLGISYLTFKTVQVIIETHDGLIKELNLFQYLYFLVFFPPFSSGPIDRSRRFFLDCQKKYTKNEYADLLSKGLLYILIGATYKFLLSGIFLNNEHSFASYGTLIDIITYSYCWGFNLFFDFAGYSFMAVGASYCFGISTPKNFNMPFISIDIKDFWNRWHITLSFWLRDYIFSRFIMLSAKKKFFKSRLTSAVCGYMINMTIMGFWHGINTRYIIYGVYHGVLLSATDVFQKKSKFYAKVKDKRLYKIVSWFITINLVMFGFLIFSGRII
jgi:membrane protein involved in D-alanine export